MLFFYAMDPNRCKQSSSTPLTTVFVKPRLKVSMGCANSTCITRTHVITELQAARRATVHYTEINMSYEQILHVRAPL